MQISKWSARLCFNPLQSLHLRRNLRIAPTCDSTTDRSASCCKPEQVSVRAPLSLTPDRHYILIRNAETVRGAPMPLCSRCIPRGAVVPLPCPVSYASHCPS